MSITSSTVDIPKEPAIRRAWVVYQLRIRGLSFGSLARDSGVSRQAISNALLMPSSHLEEIIAEAIGLTAQELFPERFDATGRRLHRTRSPERNTRANPDNVKTGEAA